MKICKDCKLELNLDNFYKHKSQKDGLHYYCKVCCKNRYLKSSEKIKLRKKKYYQENKDKYNEYSRKSYAKYKDVINLEKKRKKKEYLEKNRERIKYMHNQYIENRKKQDVSFKLGINLRLRLLAALKRNYKTGSAVSDLGCPLDEFKKYIESKFKDGMTWENWGRGTNKWHLDHIIPLSKVNLQDKNDFQKVMHYTNYQPLWWFENIQKSNRL